MTAPERSILETERLILEPVSPAHATGIYAAVVDSRAELLPWMPWARDPSEEGTIEVTRANVRDWMADNIFNFAIIEKESGMVLGVAGFNRRDSDVELHYWIRTDHAGRGLTTEACRALIIWARSALGLHRLTLWAGRENHASRRVAEKLGFHHLGPLSWRPDGGMGDFDAESYELVLAR